MGCVTLLVDDPAVLDLNNSLPVASALFFVGHLDDRGPFNIQLLEQAA